MLEPTRVTNSVLAGSAHTVVQAGSIDRVELGQTTAPSARSRYREVVREIAPRELVERGSELADLAAFCTGPATAEQYLWVRAPKWSGKTALLSWFALRPPPQVVLVSFFITARLVEQDHRGAFTSVLLEQLADLLDQPLPQHLTESTREAHLLGLLADATELCRARGQRLVLLVDGLDEDRGTGASIAALLPRKPRPDLRVIVSSRPNPPIPVDVPATHPLRSPDVRYPLSQSPAAKVIKDDMERELLRLLECPGIERHILGLLTAAAGGLTAPDLAELTDTPIGEVNRRLRRVATRLFDVRPSRWRPGISPDLYLLGHDELHQAAAEHFGARLADYRDELHTWAAHYQQLGWPDTTPEYLLGGYTRMLHRVGDKDRVVALVTDHHRQDRMASCSGDDAAAFAEISEIDVGSDLVLAARLSVHRDRLSFRNGRLPFGLLSVWTVAGEGDKAESLIAAFRGASRARAQVAVAIAAAATGDFVRAERVAASIDTTGPRAAAHAGAGRAAATIGAADAATRLLACAEATLSNLVDPTYFPIAATEIIAGLIFLGSPERGLELLTRLPAPTKDQISVNAVHALARVERFRLANQVAHKITDRAQRLVAHATLAQVHGEAGRPAPARTAAVAAKRAFIAARDPARTPDLIGALVAAGDLEWATYLLSATTQPAIRFEGVVAMSRALHRCGHTDAATATRTAAKNMLATGTLSSELRLDLAHASAEAGHVDEALDLIAPLGAKRLDGLARIATHLASAGRTVEAKYLADQAEDAATRHNTPWDAAWLEDLAAALSRKGAFDHAESVTAMIPTGRRRQLAQVTVASALCEAGLTTRAATLCRQITDSDVRATAPTTLRTTVLDPHSTDTRATLFDLVPTRAPTAISDTRQLTMLLAGRWQEIVSHLTEPTLIAITEELLTLSTHHIPAP